MENLPTGSICDWYFWDLGDNARGINRDRCRVHRKRRRRRWLTTGVEGSGTDFEVRAGMAGASSCSVWSSSWWASHCTASAAAPRSRRRRRRKAAATFANVGAVGRHARTRRTSTPASPAAGQQVVSRSSSASSIHANMAAGVCLSLT